MTLKLGMQHRVLKYFQICSNGDPRLTLTYFTASQIWFLMLLYGKTVKNGYFRIYCRLWFETSNRWPKWQEVSDDIKTLSPGGSLPPAPGLYTCIKSWKKNCIKSDCRHLFETCNKWTKWQDISVDIKTPSPGGCLPLPWGYIHVLNHFFFFLYKIRLWKDFFETCNKWMKWQDVSVNIKTLSLWGCHIKADLKEIFSKLATNDLSDKMFLLTSKFCPKGVVSYIHL